MLLNKDPEEYDRLIESLTIKVSRFFSDPEAFDLLGAIIIPKIVAQKKNKGAKKIRPGPAVPALARKPIA